MLVDQASPRVSVLIVGWNSPGLLLRCLTSVAQSVRDVSYEVVVALNEPTAQMVSAIEHSGVRLKLKRSRTNLGFGGAANLAASVASGEFLVFLNEDASVLPGWLESLVETADRRADAHAVGSQFLAPDGVLQEAGSVIWSDGSTSGVGRGETPGARRYQYERRVDYCSAASLLVRRTAWEEHNGFDENRFFPAYYEDADLCFKIAAAGGSVWYQPRSRVIHQQATSTSSYYREFLFERNRARFLERWRSELKAHLPPSSEPAALKRAIWMAMGSPIRVLVVDDRYPDSSRGSGYARMFDLVSDLQSTGRFHVGFVADGATTDAAVLDPLGVEVIDDDLEAHLSDEANKWDAILISRPHNFRRWVDFIRDRRPHTPLVYDAEALYSKRIDREAALTPDAGHKAALELESWTMRGIEEEAVRRADAVVCISDDEANDIRTLTKSPVRVHSPLLRAPRQTSAGFLERNSTIGFVAGWLAGPSSPNVDGLQWFARHILPLVRASVPSARLLVTGVDPPAEVLSLASPAVEFVGGLHDLSDFYGSIRVAISPTRIGAGVKLKTIEALQYGVPTVATHVGAEGVPVTDQRSLPRIDDAARFAQVAGALLSDRKAWEAQRQRVLAECARWAEVPAGAFWPDLLEATVGREQIGAAR